MPKVYITILDETREKINKAYYHHHYKIIYQSIYRDARWSGQRRWGCTNGIFRYHPSPLDHQSSVESRMSSMDSRVQSLILPRLIFLDLIFSSLLVLLCNTTPLSYCCVWRPVHATMDSPPLLFARLRVVGGLPCQWWSVRHVLSYALCMKSSFHPNYRIHFFFDIFVTVYCSGI